jgi:hypothetical protein
MFKAKGIRTNQKSENFYKRQYTDWGQYMCKTREVEGGKTFLFGLNDSSEGIWTYGRTLGFCNADVPQVSFTTSRQE